MDRKPEPATARRPGRPRSDRARRVILNATLELLVEHGFDGMSVEAVATRAGVGKATIYRRWSSKQELVAAALASIDDDVRTPDTGNTRDDMIVLVHDFARVSVSSVVGPMIARLAGAAASNPALMDIAWNNLIAPRQDIGRRVLRRGIERGDVRPDIDVDLVMTVVAGTALFSVVFERIDVRSFNARLERLVDVLWSGIRADPTEKKGARH